MAGAQIARAFGLRSRHAPRAFPFMEDKMKSCLLALPLLTFAAVVLTSACSIGGSVGVGPGASAGVSVASCADDGAGCVVSDDCCSNVCAVVASGAAVCATA